LVSLINEVLDQVKIESGKIEIEAVQFDLRAILDDVVSLLGEISRKRSGGIDCLCYMVLLIHLSHYLIISTRSNLQLAVHISENVPQKLIGDPGRFRQIITNLIGNSVTVSYLSVVHTFFENFVFESQVAIIILE